MLKFDACLLGCEVPIGLGVAAVAIALPRCDFRNECVMVRDTAVEALRGQDAEFGFSQVEPAAVFRSAGWSSFVT